MEAAKDRANSSALNGGGQPQAPGSSGGFWCWIARRRAFDKMRRQFGEAAPSC